MGEEETDASDLEKGSWGKTWGRGQTLYRVNVSEMESPYPCPYPCPACHISTIQCNGRLVMFAIRFMASPFRKASVVVVSAPPHERQLVY